MLLLSGLALLVLGAEGLVRGGGRLALILRVSPAVVGLTLVAWGTSAPELVVSVTAAVRATTDMALGNIVGSSIANIALVLGFSALLSPLPADGGVRSRDFTVLLASQLALPVMLFDGEIGRLDGVLLILLGVVYNLAIVRDTVRDRADAQGAASQPPRHWLVYVAVTIGGVGLLAYGSGLFIDGASSIAQTLGVSPRVIGLTVVALGTSAPELATSLVATLRGDHDVSIGNVVGSNIFNIVFALGITAVVTPIRLPVARGGGIWIDIAVSLALTLALLPFLVRRRSVRRLHGALLVLVYAAYMTYLVTTPS